MDLLASYSDDADSGKNTPTFDKFDRMPPKIDPSKSDMSLEAEWESFEKMIGGGFTDSSDPPPLPVAAPQMPVLTENMNLSLSEPPILTSVETPSNSANHVDPPILSNMNEPPKITDNASTSHAASPPNKFPPKLTDISLSPEFNSDSVFRDLGNDDMPTLTKMTGSPTSSPDHSSSRSSSSGSRSSSVESVKSTDKRRSASPVSRKKSMSPVKTSSSSHRKDEKRGKRSRSRSRSHSPHRKRRRSSDRKRSRSRSRDKRRPSDRRRRSRSRGKKSHHSSSQSRHRRRSHSRSRRRSSKDRRSSRERHRRKEDSHRREKRGRSRDRNRSRDRSKDRHRRSHSRERRSLSRERRRSRSGTPIRGRERFSRPAGSKNDKKPLTFKEQMRQQLLKASKILSEQGEGAELKDLELPKEKPSNLPLNATNMFSAASTGSGVTPQMALLQTMAAMHQKAQEMTGVAVPKYYNPAAVNPLKYAEQVQKRKLLWSKNKEKKEEDSQWQSTAFVQDQDGKMASKFRKLMGMKEHEECQLEDEKAKETEEQKKKTEEMFYRLDKEYEFARMTTHTHRGVGLGFSSQGFPTQTFPQNP